MKKILATGLICLFVVTACKKNNGPVLSGSATIDNTLSGTGPYYAFGFSFTSAVKVSTLSAPLDVITINAVPGNFNQTYFDAQNFNNSFYLFGTYADAAAASLAFKNLTSFSVTQWMATGNGVKENQIWIFRTSNDTYVKFIITKYVGETRNNLPYVQCSFDWVLQPDGTQTFPGK